MIRKCLLVSGLVLAVFGGSALAFEEQKGPHGPAAKSAGPSVDTTALSPGLPVPKIDSGTKVRVPGLGVIGEIPKMDFGLELLYGASQPKQPTDENQANGVMGRVTVPLKTPR